MKSFLLLFILMIGTIPFAQNKEILKSLKGIEGQVESFLTEWKCPGFAVAVVDQNGLVWSKGFGYKDLEKNLKVDPNTLFAIGSCSKAFTTALIGQLESAGKLSLEDKPSRHIEGFKFYNKEMDDLINISDLMCHRTGMPRHDFSWYFFQSHSKDTLISRIQYQDPLIGLREGWIYNNFMFLLQGVIIERLTNKSWEQNVEEELFAPLGMDHSNTTIQEMKDDKNASLGYKLFKDSIVKRLDYYDIAGMSPAGSINSSVNDMANWVQMLINNGTFKEKEIVPGAFVSAATSSQMVISGGQPSEEDPDVHLSNYGYAWAIASYKGHYRVSHGGNIDGFSASTCFFPSDSLGIIVLCNQDGSRIPALVRNTIADRILNVRETDWNAKFVESRTKSQEAQKELQANKGDGSKKGTSLSHPMADYSGAYHHKGYGTWDMQLRNDSLFAVSPTTTMWLRRVHYDIFEPFEVSEIGIDTNDRSFMRFNYRTNNQGELDGIDVTFSVVDEPKYFEKQIIEVEMSANNLEKYVGDYELTGGEVSVLIKEANKLFVAVPGQGELRLIPLSEKKFSIEGLDGFFVEFDMDSNGISGLSFIQPNGTFKATKK
jgi:CubicO group peptidase (beta-lactamase class C family)